MGGTLSVTSEVGEGSTFAFAIPLEPVADLVEVDLSNPAPPPSRPATGRILLAEDNLVNQQVLLLRLQQAGFEVSIAANGREAVEAFDRGGIDLILMDVQMPEMDGLRATRLIRVAREGRRRPHPHRRRHRERPRGRAAPLPRRRHGRLPQQARPERGTLRDGRPAAAPAGPRLVLPRRAAPPPPETPDWRLAMRAMNFEEEAIDRLIHAFTSTVPERLASLQEAVDQADPAQVVASGHTLKGSLVVFGAKQAADLAGRLEQAGREGKIEEAATLLAALREAIAPLLESMRDYLTPSSP